MKQIETNYYAILDEERGEWYLKSSFGKVTTLSEVRYFKTERKALAFAVERMNQTINSLIHYVERTEPVIEKVNNLKSWLTEDIKK